MNCDQCQELLVDYSLETLPSDQVEAVADHLSNGCATCADELDQWRETLASLALALQTEEPPARVRRELLDRVAGRQSIIDDGFDANRLAEVVPFSVVTKPAEGRVRWLAYAPYVAATLAAVIAGVFASGWSAHRDPSQAALVREFEERLASARQTFKSPRLRLASLSVPDERANVVGHLIWDGLASQVHFYAFELGRPTSGNTYRLWFVTPADEWTLAGELSVDGGGTCAAVLDVPPLPGDIARAVVIEEPSSANRSAKPQGPPRWIANFPAPNTL